MGNSESAIITRALLKRGIIISPKLFKAKSPECEKYQFKCIPKDSSKGSSACTTGSTDSTDGAGASKESGETKNQFPASNLWRKITFLLVLPALGGVAYAVFNSIWKQERERPEFVPYTYLRLRHKRFPWGDGTKTLFHNPHVNPLPDGYEDEK